MMEKRNVIEPRRTPDHELDRPDSDWDKEAAAEFKQPEQPELPATPPSPVKVRQPGKPIQLSGSAFKPVRPIAPMHSAPDIDQGS